MEKKARIFVTRRIPEAGLARLREETAMTLWDRSEEIVPRERLMEMAPQIEGLLALPSESIDREFFEAASRLRIVSNYAVGYDNIDVQAARDAGVMVANTPDVLTDATADLAFALILTACRRVAEGERLVRSGRWKSWGPELLLGKEVTGASLGIVGLGRIGMAVAERAAGFRMPLFYTGTGPKEEARRVGADWLEIGELLATCEIVSLHCPLTPETYHLIGEEELGLMRDDAVLINTGRGGLVDQEALYRALKEGRVAAAGLDVFEPEPLPADHPLLTLDNCVAAPHIGSASRKARDAMAELAAANLLAGLRGGEPPARVC
ncbi:MAG: D-glycerate dehydrogenase [Synergistales bacterium]|nr:D-glycerate dehydrogenase [Synergistales bacterium]